MRCVAISRSGRVASALSFFLLLGGCAAGKQSTLPPAPPDPAATAAQAPGHDHAAHPDHAAHHDHSAHPGHAAHGGGSPDGHHGMHDGFKNAEEWAKSFDDPARDAWQHPDEVVALLEISAGMTVADVGAGTGYFVGRLVQKAGPAGTVIATDLEPDMIRYLGQRAGHEGWKNVHPLQVTADDPGLGKAAVDRVLVVDVWHHLGDRRAYAAKLAAALRPGGLVAVVDFDENARRGPPPSQRQAPQVILDELRSAGLTATLAAETLPEQYVVIARAPR